MMIYNAYTYFLFKDDRCLKASQDYKFKATICTKYPGYSNKIFRVQMKTPITPYSTVGKKEKGKRNTAPLCEPRLCSTHPLQHPTVPTLYIPTDT